MKQELENPENWTMDGTGESIIKHPNSLIVFGYHLDETDQVREKALREAVKAYGVKKVREKLSALVGFNKHTRFNGIPTEDKAYVNRYAKRMGIPTDTDKKTFTLMEGPLVVKNRLKGRKS